MTRPHRHSGGFTVVELMVTIAVVAVLLSLAAPAFTEVVRNTRIANQTNAIIGSLNFARAESATRGMPVSICAAADSERTTCVAAGEDDTAWDNGWIVFTDRSGIVGELDATDDTADEVLQTGDMPAGGFTISSNGTFIRFGVGAAGATERIITVMPTTASVCLTTGRREIAVGRTGRVNSSKRTCS